MEYLGSLGRLIGLRCASREQIDGQLRYTEEFTVEGRRRVQVRPVSPRAWDVSWAISRPSQIAAMSEFVTGAWGHGPWHWVPVQAQSGNLLTPAEAQLLERAVVSTNLVQDAGPVLDAAGEWSPRSVTVTASSGWVSLARGVPVIPGRPFTFSCDVEGSDPQVTAAFYDAAGTAVSAHSQAGTGSVMQRVSVSVTVPDGAVEAYVGVRSTVTRATRPQVTWTSGPVPWSPGYGCRAAVVDGVSEDLLAANRFGTYSQVGFTVLEVS